MQCAGKWLLTTSPTRLYTDKPKSWQKTKAVAYPRRVDLREFPLLVTNRAFRVLFLKKVYP
jgi:hypothetical protein